ncbi:MAG: hypothetical protein WA865_02350 [Spirulinaceae cyanobacterium]
MKYFILWLLIISFWTISFPAEASFCRNYQDKSICILSIKRSAKNYWEYRASVKIDGVVSPVEVYNCRDRLRVKKDGQVVPFQKNGAGQLICSFFKK